MVFKKHATSVQHCYIQIALLRSHFMLPRLLDVTMKAGQHASDFSTYVLPYMYMHDCMFSIMLKKSSICVPNASQWSIILTLCYIFSEMESTFFCFFALWSEGRTRTFLSCHFAVVKLCQHCCLKSCYVM